MKAILLGALVAALATSAHASDTSPSTATTTAAAEASPPTVEAAAKADPNEKVCKLERQLGSNKMKRVCRSRAEVDAERAAAREAVSREQRR